MNLHFAIKCYKFEFFIINFYFLITSLSKWQKNQKLSSTKNGLEPAQNPWYASLKDKLNASLSLTLSVLTSEHLLLLALMRMVAICKPSYSLFSKVFSLDASSDGSGPWNGHAKLETGTKPDSLTSPVEASDLDI